MSVIDTLVTDRTQSDIDYINTLKNKIMQEGIGALTLQEYTDYFSSPKGCYNYTDLNRVGEACNYLYNIFLDYGYCSSDYTVLRTDWTYTDTFEKQDMLEYINSVKVLKALFNATQTVPSTLINLNYEQANNIEKLLIQLDDMIDSMNKIFLRPNISWSYSGAQFYIKN